MASFWLGVPVPAEGREEGPGDARAYGASVPRQARRAGQGTTAFNLIF